MIDINPFPRFSELSNIESNFRVFAGPGAGKTKELISHLTRVLRESRRLIKTRKIACITYTNVATEEIIKRLDCDKNRFDISTIHSFLYRNIVKPFCYLIETDEDGNKLFDIDQLDGHDENIPRRDIINKWIRKINEGSSNYWYLTQPEKFDDLFDCLKDLDWKFDSSQTPILKFRNQWINGIASRLRFPRTKVLEYKKIAWLAGIMHHEDVLYFSYVIICRSPRVLDFVRNKFPYIFIDEFQDTTELQTWIIKKIAELGTKVGVIGDLSQSIYKFAGAVRTDFETLHLESMRDFKLDKNYRSSNRIIEFLNSMRTDIQQEPTPNTIAGEPVRVLIGSDTQVVAWLQANGHDDIVVLSRKNDSVESLRSQAVTHGDDLLKSLYAVDSNSVRVKVLHEILMGYKFYDTGHFKDAIRQVLKPLKSKSANKVARIALRKSAINILVDLKRIETRQCSLFQYYTDLRSGIVTQHGFSIGSTFRSGDIKTFYESNSVSSLLGFIRVDTKSEDTVRTIHSAKGTEFDRVLVHFGDVRDFEHCVLDASRNLDSDADDTRIYYVGLSRARTHLFISIPEADESTLQRIDSLNLEIVRLPLQL